jgi:mediator of RNA polymerase II transcription subunit 13
LTPHSEPASVPPAEPTMPTLSPQPPSSHTNTAPPLTPSQGPKSISSACNNQVHSPSVPGPVLKRPILASREYEGALLEDEQSLSWLYDYSTQEAWLNHPVKRFKGVNTVGPPTNRSNTLYPPINSQTHQSQAPKLEIKQEPIAVVSIAVVSINKRD